MTQHFKLTEEFIELNKLLKVMSWVESGGMANQVITEGMVQVDGAVETRKRRKIRNAQTVKFQDQIVVIK